ncbi:MAG: hypothetical protein K2X38_01510 [Gemmataceae bacterium]|nr:hypothetical protein [Gemmataceae bacterium]
MSQRLGDAAGHGIITIRSEECKSRLARRKPRRAAHDLAFSIDVPKSSWVALRHFPQMHSNPVEVIVEGKPIRTSRQSAVWRLEVSEELWRVREAAIIPSERHEARKTFEWAKERYRKIAQECAD